MDGARRLAPHADLRVGDTDRQGVVDELQRHYVEGRLDSDELGERVTQAWRARTFADLAVPLTDLPHLAEKPLALDTAHQEPRAWEAGGYGPPVGAILIMLGFIFFMSIMMFPGWHHLGLFPFWPVLIWGFFFVGRTHRSRRRW